MAIYKKYEMFSFINNTEIFINDFEHISVGQKLFCTFTLKENLEDTLNNIIKQYTVLYDKIFILESPQSSELLCTYNIDLNNTNKKPLPHTILLHRKKEYNTLYTINALNALIKENNNGFINKNYIVDWNSHRNSILLTNGSDLRKLNTTIYRIVTLNND